MTKLKSDELCHESMMAAAAARAAVTVTVNFKLKPLSHSDSERRQIDILSENSESSTLISFVVLLYYCQCSRLVGGLVGRHCRLQS